MKVQITERENEILDSCANIIEESGEALSRFGARMAVLCKFVDAVLPYVTAMQSRQIDPLFRQGIEDLMSRTDDISLPAI